MPVLNAFFLTKRILLNRVPFSHSIVVSQKCIRNTKSSFVDHEEKRGVPSSLGSAVRFSYEAGSVGPVMLRSLQ